MDVLEKTILKKCFSETFRKGNKMNFYEFIMKRFIERK